MPKATTQLTLDAVAVMAKELTKKEKQATYQKKYSKAHKAEMIAQSKAWYEEHKEDMKAINKAYWQTSKGKEASQRNHVKR